MLKLLLLGVSLCSVLALEPPAAPLSPAEAVAQHVDHVLQDPELVQGYFDCFKGQGPCTPGGENLKRVLPDAVRTDCASCTASEKSTAAKVLRFAQEKRPDLLQTLLQVHGLEEEYRRLQQQRRSH